MSSLEPPSDQPSAWTAEQKLTQYKMLFEAWKSTCTERTEYNKWFTQLLVIDLFLAAVSAIIGASTVIVSSMFLRGLVTLLFIAGAVISFAWFLKLWALKVTEASQVLILMNAELDAGLSPFAAVTGQQESICKYLGLPPDICQVRTPYAGADSITLPTALLSENGEYTQTPAIDVYSLTSVPSYISGSVSSDAAGTLLVQHSEDNLTFTTLATVEVSAATTTRVPVTLLSQRYVRFRHINGAAHQKSFVLEQTLIQQPLE